MLRYVRTINKLVNRSYCRGNTERVKMRAPNQKGDVFVTFFY